MQSAERRVSRGLGRSHEVSASFVQDWRKHKKVSKKSGMELLRRAVSTVSRVKRGAPPTAWVRLSQLPLLEQGCELKRDRFLHGPFLDFRQHTFLLEERAKITAAMTIIFHRPRY